MIRVLGGLITFAALGLLLTNVSAQDDAKGKGKGKFQGKFDAEAIFKKLDTNNDGKLTKDEYLKSIDRFADKINDADKLAKLKEMMGKSFDKAADGGSSLTLDQYKKMQEERAKAFGNFKKKKKADDQ